MAARTDDFGLPIRRFPTPEPEAQPSEQADQEDKPKVEVQKEVENKAAPNEQNAPAASDKKPVKGEDSGDRLEDVRTQQPSKEATPEPEPTSKPDALGISEPKPSETPNVLGPSRAPIEKIESSNQSKDVEAPAEPSKHEGSKETIPEKIAEEKTSRGRGASNASGHRAEVSEFSHQPLAPRKEEKEEEQESQDWQEMPSFARYDMYDDDNRLVAREYHEDEDTETYGYGGLGGAGKGYTRVTLDDDANSVTSMDDNTKYLFKEANGTSMMDNDDEARDAVSQMQATKDLLTEGQRIAYVGLVRLEIASLVSEAENMTSTRKVKKMVGLSTEAMRMWGQKMMIRVYAHMDISAAEQVMIEQLAEHGVMPGDLTPALMANARVKNPLAGTPSKRLSMASPGPDDESVAEAPPPYEAHESGDVPDVQSPSQLPTTAKIDIDLRWTVLCDLFLILIADSVYDARSRVLLERVGKSLDITWIDICRFEKKVTDALEMQQAAEKENWNEDEHMEARRKRALKKRYVMMGLATVGGGLVIGLSAGLLAPVIGAGLAAGFTTIGVTGTSSFLAGAGGAAIITSSAAASGSIIGGRAAERRTGAVKTFEYRPLHNNKRVNLIVTVSGWLTGKVDDVRLPFSTVDPVMGDIYSVLWEPDMLRSMGDTINILATEALTQGLQQVLGSTILVALMSAIQLPVVLTKLSYLIDNPWAVSLDRATAAGKILADSLIERSLGARPITLVGYSIGSRVIFSCLLELAKRGCYGVVQNAYLFGSPVVVKAEEYHQVRTAVSGRFVNGFNRSDWVLGYLFRLTNGGIRRVAGLVSIDECPWVENIDVTDMVNGHMDYRKKMPKLLMKCGWTVESEEFTEIEDPDPDNHQERQRELINEIEEARKQLEKDKAEKTKRFSLFGRRKKGERQAWEVYEDSAGKPIEKKDKEVEAAPGVLFDIDAIRAELAKEARYGDTEELQVREIKSTLPPMKLDISLPPSPKPAEPNPRLALRETQSADVLPLQKPGDAKASRDPSPSYSNQASYSRQPSYSYAKPQPPPAYGEDYYYDEDISMTFDTSFDDDPKPAVPPKDAKDVKEVKEEPAQRPELKATQTLPTMTVANPWGESDDEDFGKEKEISMTFA